MKTFKSLLLVLSILALFTIPIHVMAQDDSIISPETAAKNVEKLLNINPDNYNKNYLYETQNQEGGIWSIHWIGKTKAYVSFAAEVNAHTKDITSYYSYFKSTPPVNQSLKYTKAEAETTAIKFLKLIIPDKFSQTELNNNPEPYDVYAMEISDTADTYVFNFIRKVKAINFFDNYARISIYKDTLQVKQYNLNWDNSLLPDAAKAISLTKAEELYKQKLGFELTYRLNGPIDKPKAELIYVPHNYEMLDAMTGEVLLDDIPIRERGMILAAPNTDKPTDGPLKFISEAEAVLTAKKYLNIDDNFKLTSSTFKKNTKKNGGVWYLYWDSNQAGQRFYTSAVVDAINNKLVSFTKSGNISDSSASSSTIYSKEQAQKTAENYLLTLAPTYYKQTELTTSFDNTKAKYPEASYSFNYERKVGSAICPFDSFSIKVSSITGQVISYSFSWTNVPLPNTKDIINLDTAYKILFKTSNFNMNYIMYGDLLDGQFQLPKPRLVYRLDNISALIDAKTGAPFIVN